MIVLDFPNFIQGFPNSILLDLQNPEFVKYYF